MNRFNDILQHVRYKDWVLKVDNGGGDRWYLQWNFGAFDAKTGKIANQAGRKWWLSEHMTDSEIVQTAFKAAVTAEEHECREQFKFRGMAIFNPHIDIYFLLSACIYTDARKALEPAAADPETKKDIRPNGQCARCGQLQEKTICDKCWKEAPWETQ